VRFTILGFFSFLAALALLPFGHAVAEEPIFCDCHFKPDSGYQAVGIRSACNAIRYIDPRSPGGSCKISFAAIGFDERAVANRGLNPAQYRETAFSVTLEHLNALRTRSLTSISSIEFIRQALPFYFRSTYLNGERVLLPPETVAALDREVVDMSKELVGQISEVFEGRREPFDTPWREVGRLRVTPGAVEFTFRNQVVLVAIFFDPREMRG